MKKYLLVLFVITIGVIMAGCSGNNDSKTYIIATDLTYAPFEFEKDGKYTGIDIEILEAIAEIEGFTYELKPMNFNGIIPGLTSNQIDGAIAGMTITDERKEVLDFSDSYYESGISIVVKSDNQEIRSKEDLKGKIFAVKKGTTGSMVAEQLKEELGAEIRYFDDSASMFQEVINGNADACFEDYPVIAYKISLEENPSLKIVGERLTTANFGFGVKKGQNEELLKMFNEGLKKIKENGKYEEILNKYE